MVESFRIADMRAEEMLGRFMDKCFYDKLHDNKGGKVEFERKKDKISQLHGIDIELRVGEQKFIIDEKASLYYSNAMIPTFAFEIDSIQKGHSNPVEGWFVNDDLSTEYYMLIWPNIKCEKRDGKTWVRKDIAHLTVNDFTIIEAMLIEKKRLLREVEKYGCGKGYLLEHARLLRQQMNNSNEEKIETIDENIKIYYSGKIAEKPINVVIKKSLLKSIAKATYLISEDGYARI